MVLKHFLGTDIKISLLEPLCHHTLLEVESRGKKVANSDHFSKFADLPVFVPQNSTSFR